MRARSVGQGTRASLLLLFAAVFSMSFSLPAAAADIESSELIIITEDTVVSEDLYVAANRVIVRGRIEGDLIALAAQDVTIEGEVTGSVMAMAGEVVVTGIIGKSLRVTSPSLELSGEVRGDVVAVVFGFDFAADGVVAGDLVVWARDATSGGTVFGDVEGSQSRLSISGEVRGDVKVSAGEVEVSDQLHVDGDFTYRSDADATGLDLAEVDGAVVKQHPMKPNIRIRALSLVLKILVAILLAAMALVVSTIRPERSEQALEGLRKSPIRSILSGVLVLLSPLLIIGVGVAIFALAPSSTALPLIAALIPVLAAVLGLILVGGLVAGLPAVGLIGSLVRKETTIAGAVGIGSAIVGLVWLFPVVGWPVALLVLAAGIGGWLTTFRQPPDTDPDSRTPAFSEGR
jgi:cytoskeletal protein CcmA (bactofilin family)